MNVSEGLDPVFRVVCDRIGAGVLIVSEDHRIVYANRFMLSHSNRDAETVIGADLFACFGELPRDFLKSKIKSAHRLGSTSFISWRERAHLFDFRDGRVLNAGDGLMHQDCAVFPIQFGDGAQPFACIVVHDVTEVAVNEELLTAANAELTRISRVDELTGLYNRRELDRQLQAEQRRARRFSTRFSVVMMDVDHFKRVNDTHGHAAGDLALQTLARILRDTCRESDTPGRYGGEEFLVISAHTGAEAAAALGERLRLAVERESIPFGQEAFQISISVGVSEWTPECSGFEQLVSQADAALFRAKSMGRNQVQLFEPGVADG